MDGKSLTEKVHDELREDLSTSGFITLKLTYDHLYSGALEFARRTNCLTATQSITTVAGQTNYDLNADYLKLYLTNDKNEFIVKYNDGTNITFLTHREYAAIINSNNLDSVVIPYNFSIIDKQALVSRITGTATSIGTLSSEESTLNDTSAPFTNVNAGDTVYNTTDSSQGIVIEKTSNSVLITSMFKGTLNYWSSSDAYIIIPQGRKQMVLDPAPNITGHIITFYYTCKPAPVYSSYRTYRFDSQYADALVMYALYRYKYKDEKSNFGNIYLQNFENLVKLAGSQENKMLNRIKFNFNLKKRTLGDRSYH